MMNFSTQTNIKKYQIFLKLVAQKIGLRACILFENKEMT